MAGYWNKPKHSTEALRNNWYYSGTWDISTNVSGCSSSTERRT